MGNELNAAEIFAILKGKKEIIGSNNVVVREDGYIYKNGDFIGSISDDEMIGENHVKLFENGYLYENGNFIGTVHKHKKF